MCGRCALGLDKDQIRMTCAYQRDLNSKSSKTIPDWIDLNSNKQFKPTYNLCPGMLCPVIILDSHLNDEKKLKQKQQQAENRVICPMLWGLIPNWYKDDHKTIQFKTINCKCETMTEKASFKSALNKGRRCVVLIQGFYEWHKSENVNTKQPYFIYSSQNETENYENLLKLAGIFDVWYDENNSPTYSFTVLTIDSKGSSIEWLHDRMPVILDNDDQVYEWLHSDQYPISKVNNLLTTSKAISYHSVSQLVNSTSNDSIDNIKETKLMKETKKTQPSIDSFWKKLPQKRSKSRSRSKSKSPKKTFKTD